MPFRKYTKYTRSLPGRYINHLGAEQKTTVGLANQAVNQGMRNFAELMKIKGRLNTELKFLDVSAAASAVAVTSISANALQITELVQGLDEDERIGRQIKLKSVMVQVNLTIHATPATGGTTRVRVMMVQLWNAAGTRPTSGNFMNDVTDIQSFNNLDQSRQYRILFNRIIVLDLVKRPEVSFKIYRKMNTRVSYVAPTANAAGNGPGYIGLWIFDDETSNHATFDVKSRIRYIDN